MAYATRLFGLGKEEKKPTTPVTSSSSGQRFPSPGQAKSSNNTASTQLVKPTQPQQVSTNKSSQPSQATDAVEPVIEFPSSLDQIKRRKFDNKHKVCWSLYCLFFKLSAHFLRILYKAILDGRWECSYVLRVRYTFYGDKSSPPLSSLRTNILCEVRDNYIWWVTFYLLKRWMLGAHK